MCRGYKLIIVAVIFLYACGEGADKKSSNRAVAQSDQPTGADKPKTGSDLFSRYGCFTCHSLDGSVMYGPSLKDLYMKEVSVVRQGKELTVVADREYLTRAIKDPDYEKVAEYKSRVMPKPVIPEDDVDTLVDYLTGLGKEK